MTIYYYDNDFPTVSMLLVSYQHSRYISAAGEQNYRTNTCFDDYDANDAAMLTMLRQDNF